MNCAAIPEELIESEMFGHSKGSFAGAHESKVGKFQKADGGTLFLDEVGDMSLRTQAKVLRALEEQRFEPVGAAEFVQVDVRVVAATNKNLEEEIERGNFREDLFYRLNVIPFFVPPLRDRREDIPLLADHFLREFTTAYGRKPKELTPEAYRVLCEYHWPGNVRELKNLIERIVILNPQVRVDARHIPLTAVAQAAGPSAGPLRQPAGGPRGGRARVHPQEAGRDQRQRHPHRRAAGAGAQQSLSQDEKPRHRPRSRGNPRAGPCFQPRPPRPASYVGLVSLPAAGSYSSFRHSIASVAAPRSSAPRSARSSPPGCPGRSSPPD